MKLNFTIAVLINLWLVGWVLVCLWAGLKARAEAHANLGQNKPPALSVDS